ncbi:unnamed protein product, partial [Rangifer tarandus platyrhynchus]
CSMLNPTPILLFLIICKLSSPLDASARMPKLPRAANANLAEAHVPRERRAAAKARTGLPGGGAQAAEPANALGPPAVAAAAAPRPQFLSLKG